MSGIMGFSMLGRTRVVQVEPGTALMDDLTGKKETVTDDSFVMKNGVMYVTPRVWQALEASTKPAPREPTE